MIEPGTARIIIEINQGDIIVRHGSLEGNPILLRMAEAEKGEWDKLWDYLRSIKCNRLIEDKMGEE